MTKVAIVHNNMPTALRLTSEQRNEEGLLMGYQHIVLNPGMNRLDPDVWGKVQEENRLYAPFVGGHIVGDVIDEGDDAPSKDEAPPAETDGDDLPAPAPVMSADSATVLQKEATQPSDLVEPHEHEGGAEPLPTATPEYESAVEPKDLPSMGPGIQTEDALAAHEANAGEPK